MAANSLSDLLMGLPSVPIGDPSAPTIGATMPYVQPPADPPPALGPLPSFQGMLPDIASSMPQDVQGQPPDVGPAPAQAGSAGPGWKQQLPQLLMMLAGLGAAKNNPFGAAGYMRGYQETEQYNQEVARREQARQDILKRQQQEDAIRQQQINDAHADRVATHAEAARQNRNQFLLKVSEIAGSFEDPEEGMRYLASPAIRQMGQEYGVNTAALTLIPNPAAAKRTQTAINDAFTALVKAHGDEVYTPDFGKTTTMDVAGRKMPVEEILRRQTAVPRENGKLSPPMPETGGGGEGASLARRFETYRQTHGGKWPGSAEQEQMRMQMLRQEAAARHIDSGDDALTTEAKLQKVNALLAPGTAAYKAAQDLAYGKLTFSQFRTLVAYGHDPLLKLAIYQKATELNPNFDSAAFEMGFKFASNPQTQRSLAAIDTVTPNLQRIVDLSDQIGRFDEPTINKWLNETRYQLGNTKVANFRQMQKLIGDELGIALGAGTMTDMKLKLGMDITDPNLSAESFFSNMQNVQNFLVSRKQGLLNQMGIYGRPGVNPGGGNNPPPLTSTTQGDQTPTTTTAAPAMSARTQRIRERLANGEVVIEKRNDGSYVRITSMNPDGTYQGTVVQPQAKQ